MPQRSIRFPDELAAQAEAEAARLERSFSWLVVRALEAALSDTKGADSIEQAGSAPVPSTGRQPVTTAGSGSAMRHGEPAQKPTRDGDGPEALRTRSDQLEGVRPAASPRASVPVAGERLHHPRCGCAICKPPKATKT